MFPVAPTIFCASKEFPVFPFHPNVINIIINHSAANPAFLKSK